jgi:hypothetical protein
LFIQLNYRQLENLFTEKPTSIFGAIPRAPSLAASAFASGYGGQVGAPFDA